MNVNVIGLKKKFKVERMFSTNKSEVVAVDDVSFEVKEGSILAIVGESGSGKTTLARCLAGIETQDEGNILFDNEKMAYDTKAKRAAVQYIFQDTFGSLNPRMKIKDTIAEPFVFHFGQSGAMLENSTAECLKSVGIKPQVFNKYPHELSGGQRQRVVIARALSMNPKLLIADEPVSSLDVSVQAQILSLFISINKKNRTSIIFISHDLRIVKSLADDIIIMNKGKIVESGKVNDVYTNPKNDYTKLLLSSIPGRT